MAECCEKLLQRVACLESLLCLSLELNVLHPELVHQTFPAHPSRKIVRHHLEAVHLFADERRLLDREDFQDSLYLPLDGEREHHEGFELPPGDQGGEKRSERPGREVVRHKDLTGVRDARRGMGGILAHLLVHDIRGKVDIHQGRGDEPDLIPPRVIEIDADEGGGYLKEERDLVGCTDTELVEVLRCVDRPGDVDEDLLAADILLLPGDILEEHRQTVLRRIDPDVIPGFEPVVLER